MLERFTVETDYISRFKICVTVVCDSGGGGEQISYK